MQGQVVPLPSQCCKYTESKSSKWCSWAIEGSQLGPSSSQEGPSGSSVHVSHPGLRSHLVLPPEIVARCENMQLGRSMLEKSVMYSVWFYTEAEWRIVPKASSCCSAWSWKLPAQQSPSEMSAVSRLIAVPAWMSFFPPTSIQLREVLQTVYVKTIWHFLKQRSTETGRK